MENVVYMSLHVYKLKSVQTLISMSLFKSSTAQFSRASYCTASALRNRYIRYLRAFSVTCIAFPLLLICELRASNSSVASNSFLLNCVEAIMLQHNGFQPPCRENSRRTATR